MHIKNKRGQSTVEYILLLTAVVVVIIAFFSSTNKGGFQSQINATLNQATQDMNTMSGMLVSSHDSQSAPTGSTVGEPPTSLDVNVEKAGL